MTNLVSLAMEIAEISIFNRSDRRRDRQTDKQTDKQTNKLADRQTNSPGNVNVIS